MARSLILAFAALLFTASVAQAATTPLVLSSVSLPNTTALTSAAKASLTAAARAVVMAKITTKPFKCLNGQPVVTCLYDVCKDKCTSKQLCVPNYCGSCGHKCVDLALPSFNLTLPKLPALNFQMPSISLIKAPCGLNQYINISATAATVLSKDALPSVRCSDCSAGSVSNGGAPACLLCPPGTYADASLGKCRACAPGKYNSGFGAAACKPCASGSFAPLSGAWKCIPCPKGFAATGTGSTKCSYVGFSSSA